MEREAELIGRTLWNELVHRYDAGVDSVRAMQASWNSLEDEIDPERFAAVQKRLATQVNVARWWRDASTLYFQTFSKQPFPAGHEAPAHPLEFYTRYRAQRVPDM